MSPAAGRILIADRKLGDPNFSNTVIVLLTYSEMGAGGLVINGPTKVSVEKALAELPEAHGHSERLYDGGPVEHRQILALVRSATGLEDTELLIPGIYKVSSDKALRKALSEKRDIRVYAGYAGWGPGQLEDEVDAGAWHIQKGDAKMVFDEEPETLWQRLFKRLGLQLAGNDAFKEQPQEGWKDKACNCVSGELGVRLPQRGWTPAGLAATLHAWR
jgi:putative transcriptional regulator